MSFNPFAFLTKNKIARQVDDTQLKSVQSSASRNYNVNVINQLIDSESVLNRRLLDLQTATNVYDTVSLDLSLDNNNTNKDYRRTENWRLANMPEISWCLDEIMSELLDIEININCGNTYNTIDDKTKQLVEDEFNRFIELFDFTSEQFNDDLRHFMIDGEFAYEAIVSQDHPEFGVIGIRRLRSDTFDVVYSPIISNGFVLNISVDALFNQTGLEHNNIMSRAQSKLVLNKETNTYETDDRHVALTFPDVTYICYDKDIIRNSPISLIDKAREPYFQLQALQQAAIVMRITRSPERLLFNIDTGGMPDKVAGEHLRKFGNSLSKKKVATINGNITNVYNPSTMLESWIFGKSAANSGTTVSSVTSTANFSQMDDINYFHNRLLNVFKIPFSRITTAEKQYVSGSSLTYDEARFYKFIKSLQIKFSAAINKLFIYNLTLRGIDVDPSDIKIEIEPPERYTTYLNNEIIKNKFEVYEAFANREEFSKPLLMKKYLNMSLSDIKAHTGLVPKENTDDDTTTQSDANFSVGDTGNSGAGAPMDMDELDVPDEEPTEEPTEEPPEENNA